MRIVLQLIDQNVRRGIVLVSEQAIMTTTLTRDFTQCDIAVDVFFK